MKSLEASAQGKARRRLIPFLFLLYVVAYLDRVNIGFAALQMNADLGLSAAAFGLGAGIFFVGYTLFEIPSNLLLERFGARRWLARIMISWGVISVAMLFARGPASFYLLRFLLGVGEAGFFPGVILYLTYWFPAAERARAVAWFMTATALAGVVGGPLSGFLLSMHGLLGLAGWQWLFLVEGLPAVALGLVVLRVLPDGPAQAAWLSAPERDALVTRLERDHSSRIGHPHRRLADALRSGRVWIVCAIYGCTVIGLYGVSFWLPQILRGQASWSDARIAALTALPYALAAVTMVAVAAHSDRTGERRWHVAMPLWVAGAGFALASQVRTPALSLVALTVAAMGIWASLGPFWTLPTALLEGTAAAGGIALVNSVGNIGGFIGPFAVGAARDATGTFGAALAGLACLLVLGGTLALLIRPVDTHEAPDARRAPRAARSTTRSPRPIDSE